jgi:transposase
MRFVYVGIDAAKEKHRAEVRDRAGNTLLAPFPFVSDLKGTEHMLGRVLEVADKLDAEPIFGMEATGIYHLGVYAELKSRGYTVKVYNPLQLRAFRKKSLRKTYTDKTSCSAIADMLRYENIPNEREIAPEVLELREYCRARHRLDKKIGISKTQVRRNLSVIFPGYDRVFKKPFIRSSRRLLKEYTTPEAILELGEERLAEILKRESRGTFGIAKARELLNACRKATAPEHMVEPCVYETRMLLEQIELFERQLEEIDAKIEMLFSPFEENRLYTSVGGVAEVTAAAIHSNFGPLEDFPHPDKAVAFTGLDPSVFESGKFKGSEHHITKRGSPYLRHALYQAANAAIHCNPVLRKVYLRKRKEGLTHKAAVCVAARKLVRILHSMAVNKKPFYVPAHIANTETTS